MDPKTRALADCIAQTVDGPISRLLVVGCGNGAEACDLAEYFACPVDAIDVNDRFVVTHPNVTFHVMDAQNMSFESASFDAAYSFHALEHIPDPKRAVSEIHRVLREHGTFCVGVPNRSRLIAYLTGNDVTTGERVPLRLKIAWNLADWKMRLTGRWRNELGAHAGFSARELATLLAPIGPASDISDDFYGRIYSRHRSLVTALSRSGLRHIVFPCVYMLGQKTL
jgi:ubiquinone/menaquinone biosynthesis C-methylase UbiE